MPAPTARIRVGIDVGGTFTDAVMVRGGRLRMTKARTTPADFSRGFVDALEALPGVSAADVDYLVHGSTVAANAIVQGRTARVGLLTTAGFADTLPIGTQQRAALYDLHRPRPGPLVPDGLRLEARERVAPDGAVVEPLDENDVTRAAGRFARAGVEAVAVCFLFSFVNPEHELAAERLLRRALPDVPVTLSCRVAPELREYPRTATTAINASLLPLVGRYIDDVSSRLRDAGVGAPLHLMQSNGGVAVADAVARQPVALLASGPAAGVIGAARMGALAGARDLLTFDMGGTTADVGLVVGGDPQLRYRGEAAGHPVSLPQIDVLSVGAGGGSIASVDRFGALHVGPESAGADPGPAGYGLGGDRATVTDAHAVLGTLDPDRALGGRITLDVRASRRAVERDVARPLRLGVADAARAILRVADADDGAGAPGDLGRPRPRPAPVLAGRVRRRRADARLRDRRRAGRLTRDPAPAPGRRIGPRPAPLRRPLRPSAELGAARRLASGRPTCAARWPASIARPAGSSGERATNGAGSMPWSTCAIAVRRSS